MKIQSLALLGILLLSGCAPKKPVHNQVSGYYWDRACLLSVQLTAKSFCESPDNKTLTCHALKMERIPNCEQVKVSPQQ